MNLEIFNALKENNVVQEIVSGPSHIGNLYEMEEALLLATAFQREPKTYILVKKNRYQAQQCYQRLSLLLDDVLLFVMEESLRVQAIASSPEDKEGMIYTLSQCVMDPKPRIIVCNTAAYLRFLPDVEVFQSSCMDLQVDMELDMKDLKEKLNQSGYARVNYVDRPCTFASRGGIVDIFSLEYDHPIRIEFFDTEIESIRFFDEKTQRTIESIDEVKIGPASDILFSNEQIQEIQEQVFSKLDKECEKLQEDDESILRDAIEADMRAIENYDGQAHLYWYYSYIHSACLQDYVQGQVIFSSIEEVRRYVRQLNEENIAFIQEMVQDHRCLPKYTMFHDLEEKNTYSFHEFLDYQNPVTSNIFPIEKATSNLEKQLNDIHAEHVYFALKKENRVKVESILYHYNFSYSFIEPEFYEGFEYGNIAIYTEKELWAQPVVYKRYKKTFKEGQILENVLELQKNDYVVHEQYGIGQYLGIVVKKINNQPMDYLHILYRDGDDLYVPLSQFQLVRKYISKEGVGVHLSKLGSDQWKKTKERVNQKVEEIAERLVDLYANRNENIGYAFPEDDALQQEFEEAFEYEATPDQIQATEEIKAEMEKPKPMDHLLCGDVGFGKTEVAMRCAFKAITSGKQVAFLCPTTILSMQHYRTVSKRFENVGIRIGLVNRFESQKNITEVRKGLKDGSIDIVIGTHKLLNSSFEYKDLGFLIIDEEQRFGVEHKEKIKELKNSIDVLSLSATPIPRTLQMSLIGVRTISQLNTPPAQRHPIQTYIIEKRGSVIKEVIQRELARDGQVFYLYNRVSEIATLAIQLQRDFPDAKVGVVHGKMDRDIIEQTMIDFQNQKYQILVCTTIIETGLDIANANTIIIENADRFGLSQLYQIRGRVGRRDKIGYCYLMIQPQKELTEQADKRLKSIKEFTQLGSGYKVAMRDLTIRGSGDLLGPQQAGFIDQIGLDMYLEMLADAIARKKGEPVQEKKQEKQAQISLNGYIPNQFAENDGDKLSLYQEIKKIKNEFELEMYQKKVEDLYGHIPNQVQKLFVRRKIDLFVNEPGVESLQEKSITMILTMTPEWTKNCNGVKLFEGMNDISRQINLQLKNQRIEISFRKGKNSDDLLLKIIDELKRNKEIYEN